MLASTAHREAHIEPVDREQPGENEERKRAAVKRRLAQRENREECEAAYRDQPKELARLSEVDERFEGAGVYPVYSGHGVTRARPNLAGRATGAKRAAAA